MRVVSRFEANLLVILQFFLRRVPGEQALPLLSKPLKRPRCLSRDAVELVQDTLAKGCMLLLARAGGWRRERHLRGERIAEGRLWERTLPAELGLAFSGHALRFLIWVTAVQLPGGSEQPWSASEDELTLADRLLLYYAYGAVRLSKEIAAKLRALAPVRRHALCRLAYPEDYAGEGADGPIDFAPWTGGLGAAILEALQPELAQRWQEVERGKGRIFEGPHMRALGQAQEQVLAAFFQAVEAADRRDLARFLLQAMAGLLAGQPAAHAWVGALQSGTGRLADRVDAWRMAMALVRQVGRLRQWEQRARQIGYLDDGYVAGQLWKADWESWEGETLYTRAQALLRQIEPFAGTGQGNS
jgi:hypothetical protein